MEGFGGGIVSAARQGEQGGEQCHTVGRSWLHSRLLEGLRGYGGLRVATLQPGRDEVAQEQRKRQWSQHRAFPRNPGGCSRD
ncbi:hypothetical protein MFU01_56170 [Myxococcus fulvus]|uniref:Uncharacterized protein n=1 Tax=Myxococcus fulvus TaxID=33 RepID=A0A511T8S2_MYXFU|nr:hypothetical protein MFU01_56170 [Myxococcus fulvus]